MRRLAQPVEKGSLLPLMRLLFAGWLIDFILVERSLQVESERGCHKA